MNQPADHLRAFEAAFRAGRAAEAETAARAALRAAPSDPGVQHLGGMALLRLGRVEQALGPLRRAASAGQAPLPWLIALGNALAMGGKAAEAEAAFRRCLTREPDNPVVLLNLGILLTGRGAPAQAEAGRLIEASLAVRPGHAGALMALGNLRRKAGDPLAALPAYRQAVAARPDVAEAQANLGATLADLGQASEAEEVLRRALALNPGLAQARQRLGELLLELGRTGEAERELRQAAMGGPPGATAFNSLGLALRALGRLPEAEAAFRKAVAAAPDLAEAWSNLALLLAWTEQAGAAGEAAAKALALAPADHRAHLAAAVAAAARGDAPAARAASREAVRLRPFAHIPARGVAEATVLVLQALEDGHFEPSPAGAKLPEGHNNAAEHLDPDRFGRVELYVDVLAEDPGVLDRLPRCDVIYNAITEPEGMQRGLALAAQAVRRLGLPVINPPEAIPQGARDLAPALFAGIGGLVVPRVARVPATPDPVAAVRAAMAGSGIGFPVILRPVGTHTGKGMVLAHDEAGLAGLPAGTPFFLTEFVDFRAPEGVWRKTRILCVGGRILPEHLATADDWNVHHRNSRAYMGRHPEEQRREREYLDDFETQFGRPRLAAVGEMADRLGLDFFGIDAALLPDGRLLVFEANPSMRAMFAEAREGFEYLLPRIGRVSAAFCDLVLRRARQAAPV